MKNQFLLLPLAALACFISFGAPATAAEPGVELVAELIVGGEEGGTMEVTTRLQGDLLRTDIEGVSTIMNAQSGEITSILHDQKMFMVLPLSAMPPAEAEPNVSDPAEFKPTGRKETISGLACEEFVNEKEAVAVWLTREAKVPKDVFNRLAQGGGSQNPLRDFFLQAAGFAGVPMRIASTNPEAPFTMTVKSIRTVDFPAEDFAPPSSYKPLAVPPEMGELLQPIAE